jgi:Uma2 family endonuclease
MSTITSTPPSIPDWVPASLHRLTVEQYEAMVASGIIKASDRVHLINGCLVDKMTHHPPHAIADELCGKALDRLLPAGWSTRGGKPVRIPGLASEPEPDRSVVRGDVRDYEQTHPEPGDVALIVEVSKSSLAADRKMAEIFGKAGIPVYWIINVADRQVEVYTQPGPAGYASLDVLAPPHVVTVIIDGVAVGEIAVEDILPRKAP